MGDREQMPDTTGCDHDWQPMEDVPEKIQRWNFEQCPKCKNIRSDISPFPPLRLTREEVEIGHQVAKRLNAEIRAEAAEGELERVRDENSTLRREHDAWYDLAQKYKRERDEARASIRVMEQSSADKERQ